MKEEKWFRIRNWEKFQHYKKRNPPWIKLHISLLSDYDFAHLQPKSQLILLKLWLFCAKFEQGKCRYDLTWIQHQIGETRRIDLKPLFEGNFLEWCEKDASIELASRKQNHLPETETETETESMQDLPKKLERPKGVLERSLEIWNLHSGREVKGLFPKNGSLVVELWIQNPEDYWVQIFKSVKESEFLRKQKWCTLLWAMQHHFEIAGGQYNNKEEEGVKFHAGSSMQLR